MPKRERRIKIRKVIEIAVLTLFCAFILLLDFIQIPLFEEGFRRYAFTRIVQQTLGSGVAVWCMLRLGIRLFGKPQNCLYLLPCLLVALNNFQWCAYFGGKMQLVRTEFLDIILFALNCIATGLFEELVFRGIVFALFVGIFSKDKKGFLLAYVTSSVVFGLAHLLNGFSGETLLQVGYSTLTGGLFAFCLIKTKNVFCCAFVHALYNFCGLLFDLQGLGSGVVFDLGTVITMVAVSVAVGVFVLYKVWKYPATERRALYDSLGIKEGRED